MVLSLAGDCLDSGNGGLEPRLLEIAVPCAECR